MKLSSSVVEQPQPVTTLQVCHRRWKIPLAVYLQAVKDYADPWQEGACQFFSQKYLEEQSDPGIVGMVRQEHDEAYVYLDAAIRYPVAPTRQPPSPDDASSATPETV